MRNTRRSFPGCGLCRSTSLAQLCIYIDLRYYSTFVNGRSRDVIMVEMRQRIDRADAEKEIEETIQVMFSYHRVVLYTRCTRTDFVYSRRVCVILQRTERESFNHTFNVILYSLFYILYYFILFIRSYT